MTPARASQRHVSGQPRFAPARAIVHLVVALPSQLPARPVVGDDERAGVEPVERLHVADAEDEHRAPGEGVVGGDRAVRREAKDLAARARGVLRAVGLGRVARPDVQHPVRPEADAAAVVEPRRRDAVEEDPVLARRPAILGEHPAHEPVRDAAAVLRDRRVGVEAAVLGEAGVRGDAEEPALAARRHRDGRHRRGLEPPAAQEPDPARALGHERVAARQERDPPRHLEPGRDALRADLHLARGPVPRLHEGAAGRPRRGGAAGGLRERERGHDEAEHAPDSADGGPAAPTPRGPASVYAAEYPRPRNRRKQAVGPWRSWQTQGT